MLIEKRNHIGGVPSTLKSFFTALYEHPLFYKDTKILLREDSLDLDMRLYEISQKLTNPYFKESLKKWGVRRVVIKALNEMSLVENIENKIENITLENKDKGSGLKELMTFWVEEIEQDEKITYEKMLAVLSSRIENKEYDNILKEIDIYIPPKFKINEKGIEKKILASVASKTRSKEITEIEDIKPAGTKSSLSKFQKYLEPKLLQTTTPKSKEKSLDNTICVKSNTTRLAMLQEVLEWMSQTKSNCTNTAIGVFDYDDFASTLYYMSKDIEVPIYLSKGLSVTNFDFFGRMMTSVDNISLNKDIYKETKKIFKHKKGDCNATKSLKVQALSLLEKVKLYVSTLGDDVDFKEIFFREIMGVRIPSDALGLERGGLTLFFVEELANVPLENAVILGLENNNYPYKFRVEPVLDDETRKGLNLSAALDLEIDAFEIKENLVENIILNTSNGVYLGFGSHSLETGKLNIPSGLFNSILKFIGKEPSLEEIYKLAGTTRSGSLEGTRSGPLDDINFENEFANLKSEKYLKKSINDYQKDIFCEGKAACDRAIANKLPESVSASSMAKFFKCPYQFYLYAIEEIKKPENIEKIDTTVWLDYAERGTFLHDVYEQLLRPFTKDENPTIEKYRTYLDKVNFESIFKSVEDEYKKEENKKEENKTKGNDVADWIKDKELEVLRETFLDFLEHEKDDAKATEFYPIFLEKEIKDCFESIGIELPYKGKIDRINTDKNNNWQIVDYKISQDKYDNVEDDDHLLIDRYGLNIQHALYAKVFIESDEFRNENINSIESGYYFATDKGNWEKHFAKYSSFEEKLNSIIAFFLEVVNSNEYAKAADTEKCRFCDYGMFCKSKVELRIKNSPPCEQILKLNEIIEGV